MRDRYPANPFDLEVMGLEPRSQRVKMSGGEVRVGRRRFAVQGVEVTVRQAVPVVWRPKGESREGDGSERTGR